MPTPLPTFQRIVSTRNPGDIIRAQHLNLLDQQDSNNWNSWYNYLATTQLGGEYVQDNGITSRKLSIQTGTLNTSTPKIKAGAGFVGYWVSPKFAQFTIVWEKPNMTALLDWVSTMGVCFQFNGGMLKQGFISSLSFYQLIGSTWTIIKTFEFNENDGDFWNLRSNFAAPVAAISDNKRENYPCKIKYKNTAGTSSTTFAFDVTFNNLHPNTPTHSSNPASCIIPEINYQIYGDTFN